MVEKKKFHFSIILFIFLPLLIFIIKDVPVVFNNNDDFFLKQIASGELTGTPETHLLHIGYLTGVLLSTLYKLFPSIPWYGIVLFSYGYLSIILPLWILSTRIEKKIPRAIISVFALFITLSFTFMHLISIQYTTITAIVCAASITFFYISKENDTPKSFLLNNIPSFLFFFLALELRNKACIMFLPTFLFFTIIKYIKNKKMLKSLSAYVAMLLCLLVLSFGIDYIAYAQNQWHDFKEYNTSRENIVDYNGFPNYEDYRTQYENLGISYQSYISASTRYQLLLDENVNTEFMTELAKLSSNNSFSITDMCKTFINRHTMSYIDRPLNLIVYLLYFFTIIFIILSKNKKVLWDVLALICGRTVIWLYLLFIGRSLPRVTQGIYVMELLMLLAIIIGNKLYCNFLKRKKILKLLIYGACIGIVLFSCLKWSIPNTRIIIDNNKSQLINSSAYEEIRLYFYENEDNLYLLDTLSFSYFTEDAFAKTPESHHNFVLLGSWVANSPWTDSILQQYGYSSYEAAALEQNNVFFVFMNTEQTNYDYLNDYFNEISPGSSLKVADTVQCSNGIEFNILQVQFE